MRCPKCSWYRSKVVLTRDDVDSDGTIRRRHCTNCDHRWYTIQAAEVAIDAQMVVWHENTTSLVS